MNKEKLFDKVYACWLGKNIGGTLGEPVEGRMEVLDLTFYPKLSETGSLPNDDLDLQLVNLHALEEFGVRLTTKELAEKWRELVYFPYDEYGFAVSNLRRGLSSPLCGSFNNPFKDCMGSPIRSELWGIVCAGRPKLAAYFAWQDAVVDHAGGEGVFGEMFFAAIESLAFESTDKLYLIKEGLKYIPETSRTYLAVKDTLEWFKAGVSYGDIREKILKKHGRDNFTDAPQNISFTIVGLLYGVDFEDGILKAVNLGYDTDCTAATLGALYGLMYGTAFIPEKWSAPVGKIITVSPPVRGFNAPADLIELTNRTLAIMDKLSLEADDNFQLDQEEDFDYQRAVLPSGASKENSLSVVIKYEDGPCVAPENTKNIHVAFVNNSKGTWRMQASIVCPEGFESFESQEILTKQGERVSASFSIACGRNILNTNQFQLKIDRINDENIWTSYMVPFSLLKASRWELDSKECFVSGDTVRFDTVGEHTAKTTLSCPKDRMTKIICASKYPVKLMLDDESIIESDRKVSFMPAYHRCHEFQFHQMLLLQGVHKVTVMVKSEEEIPEFMFLTVATRDTKEPGANYYFIDNVIG